MRARVLTISLSTSPPAIRASATEPWTINLTKVLDSISDSVNITGPGADKLIVTRDPSTAMRIFNITTNGTVSFSGLTITRANGTGGGAIDNTSVGTVNITDCTLTNNFTSQGGTVFNSGTLNITRSTITANVNNLSPQGAAVLNDGKLNITRSTISANLGGGIVNHLTLNVADSILSTNRGATYGGAIYSSARQYQHRSPGILH
jgi:hypothetical protein